MVDRSRTELLPVLEEHYRANGSWEGVETTLQDARPDNADLDGPPPPIVLCAYDGQVVAGNGRYPIGSTVSPGERSRGYPITVDGATVGYFNRR